MAAFMTSSGIFSVRRTVGWISLALSLLVAAPVSAGQAGEWHGEYSSQRRPTIVIARSADDWRRLWDGLQATPPRPLAEGEAAIAIFLGPRRTGGYAVEFLGTRAEGCVTLVEFRERAPAPNSFVTQAFTSPWAVLTLAAPKGEVMAVQGGQRFRATDLAEQSRCR